MKKNMYSLMLSKNLIEEIDNIAYKQNTNRSNLINHILAQYLSLSTPEMKIKNIFEMLDMLLADNETFLIQNINSSSILCIKSSLSYKYKPAVKYSIELYKSNIEFLGSLKIQFRTQSEVLINVLDSFFELWIKLETKHIHPFLKSKKIIYSIDINKFERSLLNPDKNFENRILSKAILDYITAFDSILKKYINNPNMSFSEIENDYLKFLNNFSLIL